MYQRLNGSPRALLRTTSICRTPESILLDLVLRNDTESIEQLIKIKPDLLEHIYTPEYNKPILLIACSEENVAAETIKTLIDLGADTHYSSDIFEQWEAIHFAASRTNSRILKAIIGSFEHPGEINAIAKGNNALHVLIRYGKSELEEEFAECARLLVSHGIDVNLGDSNYLSPILWAAKKGYKTIIKILLETSPIPVDLDSHQSRKKTARDIILAENLYDGPLPEKVDNDNTKEETVLFKFLQTGNESGFLNFRNGEIFDLVNLEDTSDTLLQLCCKKGMFKAADHLLNKGADPNLTTQKNKKTPLEITAEMGFYKIFKSLLIHPKIKLPRNLTMTLVKYYDNEKAPDVDHAECYDYLLRRISANSSLADVNEQDESKNSALHYAMRYAGSSQVERLLELGASLGSKNKYGVMPIQDMEPEVLEKHLDRCIRFDLNRKKQDREEFAVTFNYKTLVPPSDMSEVISYCDDPERHLNYSVKPELVTETEVVAYMSQAPEFKHLLQHPVIVSFLYVKWHRIRWLFWANLLFYLIFCLSLVVYIFTSYINFNNEELFRGVKIVSSISFVVFVISFIILVFRELFQMTVSPNNYFKNFENYIEIILICIAGSIVCISSPTDDTRKQLSSLSILLVAFEMILMIGQHPKWSTNVVMLRTVSFNFFKLLVWYSLLIIAFALSFFILFSQPEGDPKNGTESKGDDEDFFTDPGKSFFKTIVMTTGEFDAGSMDFSHFPVTSKLIFSLFIFMIVIILLNLLNGLAVSDTQMIKNNAELVGHITRAQHIHYVESMLLGNILPSRFIEKLNSICCCFPSFRDCKYNLPLASTAFIFPHLFSNYEMTVYPNRYGEIDIPLRKKWSWKSCSGCCKKIYLDKETIRRTNLIVQARKEELKAEQEITFEQKIVSILREFEKSLGDDKLKIYMLDQKMDDVLAYLSRQN